MADENPIILINTNCWLMIVMLLTKSTYFYREMAI